MNMSIISDRRIKELMRGACTANGLSADFADRVSVSFESKFTRRMGDASYDKMRVRFSIPLFLRASVEDQEDTVVHEMCHIIARHLFGPRISSHGHEWKLCMLKAGRAPTRCHSVDRTGLTRTRKTMETKCGCSTHMVTPAMFTKIASKKTRRYCKKCKGDLYIPE